MSEAEHPDDFPEETSSDDLIKAINSAFDDGSESIPLDIAFDTIEHLYLADISKLKSD